jgi:hypothetical protein
MDKDLLGYHPDTTDCSPLVYVSTEDKRRGRKIQKMFDLGRIIDRSTARKIIKALNAFNRKSTVMALEKLFEHFVWNFNNLEGEDRMFIDVIFLKPRTNRRGEGRSKMGTGTERGIDDRRTASTTGYKIWINDSKIMNESFDQIDTHFGDLPKGVSHYAAVILHEFGHIIRERANETTFQYILDISPSIRDCFREFQVYISETNDQIERARRSYGGDRVKVFEELKVEREDELEEWIADMFAKSFIVYAMTRTARPRRYRTEAPTQRLRVPQFT